MLTKEDVQDIYGLAPMQEGMLIQHARDAGSDAYVEQFDFVLEGQIDRDALQKSLDALVRKYAVLRTIFSFRRTDRPRQIVLKARTALLHCEDCSGPEPHAAAAAVEDFKRRDRQRGFDLSSDMLLRVAVLKVAPARQHLVLTFHHIILDGWCLGVLFRDLFSYYERIVAEPGLRIDETESHAYREYVRWVEAQDRSAAQAYWSAYLQGYQAEAGPPYFDRAPAGETRHAVHLFSLGAGLSEALAALAKARRVTVNSIFQAAWGVLLQKYQNTDDVVFGCVVSGRPPALPGIEDMVGLFINTQPVRVACSGDEAFAAVAARVQQDGFQSAAYEYQPLFEIQSAAPLNNRLLNHIVAFENYPVSEQMKQLGALSGGLRIADVRVFEQTNYDFNVIVNPGADIRINFTYNQARYGEAVVAGLERSLRELLAQVAATPDCPVRALRICAEADRRCVVETFNATATAYPSERSVPELFAAVASRCPDAVALRYYAETYSYAELHERACAVAGALRARGIGPGAAVGLMTPRCPEMVFGILGILYCGAAYIPIDPGTSAERIGFMLEDGDAALLCTVAALRAGVLAQAAACFLDEAGEVQSLRPALPPPAVDPQAPAYIMYTSGSTGQPKGCAVSHRNIVRLVQNSDYVEFGPEHRILQTGAPAFDASTFEIWGALLNGAQLCLADEADLLDPARLEALLREQQITILWLTCALFNQLCEAEPGMFGTLRYLLIGGDVLSLRHVELARAANPGVRLINGYGPTENTTFSTTFPIERTYAARIPIGRPIANSTAYVVDAGLNLLPPGAYGELCVGGDGVALGYVKRPELNAQKFLPDPFKPGGRLYRTGDIARWLPDGSLDLLGRNDFQVKIRGFRVELGEIERCLGALPGVKEAVVLVREGAGGKQLHAFYVSEQELPVRELRAGLAARLPAYMVPAFWLRVERMPLTVNGKVDRAALPAIEGPAAGARTAEEPRSVTERRIAGIVREVLGIHEFGVHDNFFEIGANSLNLIAINNRLKQAFSKDIPLTALFEYTNVARLAELIGQDAAAQQAKLEQETAELDQARQALLKTRKRMGALEQA